MSSLEDSRSEIKDLLIKNKELVQKVQHWKIIAAQRENDKLDLIKENNELRLELSRFRSGNLAQVKNLDSALEAANEEVLTLLVRASETVARAMQISKRYVREKLDNQVAPPRCSRGGGAGGRVHKVRPMMGGQSIHPVVTLSRVAIQTNDRVTNGREVPSAQLITPRALPLHMLQDVIIPLRRIDTSALHSSLHEHHSDEEDLPVEGPQGEGEGEEPEGGLAALHEDDEDTSPTPRSEGRGHSESPVEGPSLEWSSVARSLEPDSTTETAGPSGVSPAPHFQCGSPARRFSPTVRRARPPSSPTHTPGDTHSPVLTIHSLPRRVLKVVVPKMPAPSPHGATHGLIHVEQENTLTAGPSTEGRDREGGTGRGTEQGAVRGSEGVAVRGSEGVAVRGSEGVAVRGSEGGAVRGREGGAERGSEGGAERGSERGAERGSEGRMRGGRGAGGSVGSGGDGGGGRAKRPRTDVTYKEKPLNRKLRR